MRMFDRGEGIMTESILKEWIIKFVPDKIFIMRKYKKIMGYRLRLDMPQTFCEKIQYLKLYDHNPLYTRLVDKIKVKEYVSNIIGSEHVTRIVGGPYNSFEEIDFSVLPNSFVLKCSHDSGGYFVVRNKDEIDIEEARRKITKCLKKNYYYQNREWPYKNVKPMVFAEEYLDSLGKPDSIEYKFSCFNGICKNITVCGGIAHDEYDKRTNDNYDREFKHLSWWAYYRNAKIEPSLDRELVNKMVRYAEMLSEGIPHVRVDFYLHNNTIYFGEMTFYTWGGFIQFNPKEQDDIMGEWLDISTIKR